ncbi:MAG: YidB family protein [Rhizobiales bacterium]|nr:YidB family protein [Hyphomicrobiales bacterium]
MSRRMPSLAALLGLVAIAGYQNRDKIGEFVKNMTGGSGAAGGVLDSVKKTVSSGDIQGGLGELVDQFKKAGQGETVDSWVGTGENKPIDSAAMEKSLGGDLIDGLVQQTGLSREELLDRLSKILPEAVDKMTPGGKLPA